MGVCRVVFPDPGAIRDDAGGGVLDGPEPVTAVAGDPRNDCSESQRHQS